MSWIKLEDNAADHPKIAGLSDRAFRAWVRGLCYASRFLTDGVLPTAFLVTVPRKTQDELVSASLWLAGTEITIHDYLEHQRDKASIRTQRDRNKARQQRHRNGVSNAGSNGVTNGVSNGHVTLLEESRRELEKKEQIQKPAQKARAASRFEEWYSAYPKKVGRGAAVKAWEKIHPDDALVDRMLDALKWQRNQPRWVKDGGEFIPNPATYLNQSRWEDEPFFAPSAARPAVVHELPESLRIIDEMEAKRRAI